MPFDKKSKGDKPVDAKGQPNQGQKPNQLAQPPVQDPKDLKDKKGGKNKGKK